MYVVYMVDWVDGSKTVSICGDSVFPAMRSMIQHGIGEIPDGYVFGMMG